MPTSTVSIVSTNSIWNIIPLESRAYEPYFWRRIILSVEDILLSSAKVFTRMMTGIDGVEVFSDLEASKYQMAEYRISIYGK